MKIVLLQTVIVLVLAATVDGGEHRITPSRTVVIAADGKALFPVVVSSNATPEVRRYAGELAGILTRMSGAKFAVVTNGGASGIVVGTIRDFPDCGFRPVFDSTHEAERQGYEITTHRGGAYVLGATEQAVGYAVYDLLYRMGYRQFFSSPDWEIVPVRSTLKLGMHLREVPDYYTRAIWFSGAVWPEYSGDLAQWMTANRNGGYPLNIAHMYQRIIQENKAVFDEHPEYLGLLKGRRTSNKLCISNPGLRQLVADYTVRQFERNPHLECFSVEASDGGGWCECEACAALGSPSTRVVVLANAVAHAVTARFPGKQVGICAYGFHSPPPAVDVAPGVVVCACAGFIRGGQTLESMLDGWSERKASLGVYEYYDVYLWSANQPGLSRASNLGYLRKTIPTFYQKGVRYLVAESCDGWGPNGLGYYLAERMLWNVRESQRMEELVKDFMESCFGPSAEIMRKFYDLMDGSQPRLMCPDLLGRMYRLLDEAVRRAVDRPDVLKRVEDLALYVRFCELYTAYASASESQRRKSYEDAMEFAASIKGTRMIHSKAFFQDRRLFSIKCEKVPGDWQATRSYSSQAVMGIISNGIASNRLLDFEPVRFSDALVPAGEVATNAFTGGKINPRLGPLTLYAWADESLRPLDLTITGGLITWYRDRGNVRCELWNMGGASEEGDRESLVHVDTSVPPDGQARTIHLAFKQSGLHKIVITDGGDLTRVTWPQGRRVTLFVPPESRENISGSFCFYVPRGTRVLGFECNAQQGEIRSPDGKVAFRFNMSRGHYSIPVEAGMDGKLWRISVSGKIGFMTVPPCLALEPSGLLLPQELADLGQERQVRTVDR